MKYFENLTQEEIVVLENAVSQIAVLIAGADGEIDQEESNWAAKLTHIRTFSGERHLNAFYDQVDANFRMKFRDLVQNMPKDVDARQAALSAEIAKVNPILAKLDAEHGYMLYHSYMTFADHIARSSGGFFGFASISSDEKKWVGLDMITPIAEPKKEEE